MNILSSVLGPQTDSLKSHCHIQSFLVIFTAYWGMCSTTCVCLCSILFCFTLFIHLLEFIWCTCSDSDISWSQITCGGDLRRSHCFLIMSPQTWLSVHDLPLHHLQRDTQWPTPYRQRQASFYTSVAIVGRDGRKLSTDWWWNMAPADHCSHCSDFLLLYCISRTHMPSCYHRNWCRWFSVWTQQLWSVDDLINPM